MGLGPGSEWPGLREQAGQGHEAVKMREVSRRWRGAGGPAQLTVRALRAFWPLVRTSVCEPKASGDVALGICRQRLCFWAWTALPR